MKLLEDLKNLKNVNPKNPGSWPWVAKLLACVVIFIVVLAAGFVLDWQDQFEKLSGAKQEEANLKMHSWLRRNRPSIWTSLKNNSPKLSSHLGHC